MPGSGVSEIARTRETTHPRSMAAAAGRGRFGACGGVEFGLANRRPGVLGVPHGRIEGLATRRPAFLLPRACRGPCSKMINVALKRRRHRGFVVHALAQRGASTNVGGTRGPDRPSPRLRSDTVVSQAFGVAIGSACFGSAARGPSADPLLGTPIDR